MNSETEASRPSAEPNPFLRAAWRGAESLCIKCGFCLPVCPTYGATGVESASPRGRLDLMYAVAEGDLTLDDIRAPLGLCLGCLACETACPAGIRFGDMLEAGHREVAATQKIGPLQRFLLLRVLPSPPLLRALAWGLWAYQRSGLHALVRGSRLLSLLSPALGRLERNMPPLPVPLRWRRPTAAPPRHGARAVLLTGCVMDALFGAVHAATVKVLQKNGVATLLPPGQGCCGALQLHSGETEAAKELARRNIAACEGTGDAPILVNAAGCGALLKNYGGLLADDPDWAARAEGFAGRVRDISEFLDDLPLKTPPGKVELRVAYDDPCHLLHAQKVGQPPRNLLAKVPGLELVTLPEADRCCGSAGSYSLTQPEMSAQVLERKMEHIAACGAEVVATGNPGCVLQIRLGVKNRGLKVEVIHPIQLLARAYG
ncbi:MAG: heterodisulfide reductase-related iron-sulfur binding cluster [bacterium]